MKLGVHVSIAGNIEQSVQRAADFGCNTFQIFLSSPHSWDKPVLSEESINNFRSLYSKYGMQEAIAHSIYLINLATSNNFNLNKSIESLISDLDNCGKLGLAGLVTHVGSYRDSDPDEGIKIATKAISGVLNNSKSPAFLLLENNAGAGSLIGRNIEELAKIINDVNSERLGICIDTAHAFEYGYELHEEKRLNDFIEKIDNLIGLHKIKAIHLNDSVTKLGSNLDRHEEFGKGEIGKEGMTRIINHPKLRDISFIMETPQIKKGEAGRELVEMVRSLQKS